MSTPLTYVALRANDSATGQPADVWAQYHEDLPDGQAVYTYWLAGPGTYVTGIYASGQLREPDTGLGYGLTPPKVIPPMPPEPAGAPEATPLAADWWVSPEDEPDDPHPDPRDVFARYNRALAEFGALRKRAAALFRAA